MHVNYPGFLTYIAEAAFCVFFNSDVVRGINVTVARGQALMLRQSGDKHNQPGLKLTLCKNKGIVSFWYLKVIFCLSLLMESFAPLELFTEKLCFFLFLVFFVLLRWFMTHWGKMASCGSSYFLHTLSYFSWTASLPVYFSSVLPCRKQANKDLMMQFA